MQGINDTCLSNSAKQGSCRRKHTNVVSQNGRLDFSSLLLFSPCYMTLNFWIFPKSLKIVKILSEFHLRINLMQSFVTKSTNPNTDIQFFTCEISTVKGSPMNFSRDQMMKFK